MICTIVKGLQLTTPTAGVFTEAWSGTSIVLAVNRTNLFC